MKIPTKDLHGVPNGWLQPLWNVLEKPDLRPDQVYVTAIAPRSRKGPHLHRVRRGMFFCIRGDVTIRLRHTGQETKYFDVKTGDSFVPVERHSRPDWWFGSPLSHLWNQGENGVIVPAGIACALYNFSDQEALIVNMPSPSWSEENPDDWPVENWVDPTEEVLNGKR